MHVELACLDKRDKIENVINSISEGVKLEQLNVVLVPPFLIPEVKEFLPSQIYLAAAVDYPGGQGLIKSRVAGIIECGKRGAQIVDIVCNCQYINDGQWDKVEKDIQACVAVCKDYNVVPRFIADYDITCNESLYIFATILTSNEVAYLSTSTATHIDEWVDNVVFAYELQQKTGISPIISTRCFLSKENFDAIECSDAFGVRFTSINSLKHSFGV